MEREGERERERDRGGGREGETDRNRDRDRLRQTERQTDRQTDRQRQTETETDRQRLLGLMFSDGCSYQEMSTVPPSRPEETLCICQSVTRALPQLEIPRAD